MYMFYDTETTGLINYKTHFWSSIQPGIVQLAIILCDENGIERSSFCSLVQPGNKVVEAQAARATGITTEIAQKYGIPLTIALAVWRNFCKQATHLVGHNEWFDWNMVDISHRTLKLEGDWLKQYTGHLKRLDTKDIAAPFCKIPPTQKMIDAGRQKQFKTPKLGEAYEMLLGEKLEGAHDALADTRATAKVFFECLKLDPTIACLEPATGVGLPTSEQDGATIAGHAVLLD